MFLDNWNDFNVYAMKKAEELAATAQHGIWHVKTLRVRLESDFVKSVGGILTLAQAFLQHLKANLCAQNVEFKTLEISASTMDNTCKIVVVPSGKLEGGDPFLFVVLEDAGSVIKVKYPALNEVLENIEKALVHKRDEWKCKPMSIEEFEMQLTMEVCKQFLIDKALPQTERHKGYSFRLGTNKLTWEVVDRFDESVYLLSLKYEPKYMALRVVMYDSIFNGHAKWLSAREIIFDNVRETIE